MASVARRSDGRWRARYRDPAGREHAKHFDTKTKAQRWLDEVTAAIVTGQYVDPNAGRRTFGDYATSWASSQVHRDSTRVKVESSLRRHVLPHLGDRPLASLRRSDIQTWVKARSDELAPGTVRVIYSYLAAIFRAAVDDRLIPASPCSRIALPRVQPKRVEPLATETVFALAEAVQDRYRALILLAAGTGMRQGECFGLTGDRVDFLRRAVTVDRQLVSLPGRPPALAVPKTTASHRTIPLPNVVLEALASHLAAFPRAPSDLLFTLPSGAPINRGTFSSQVWQPAARLVGLREGVSFHDLRHYYASLLIRHGESVKVVQARLGHASAAETLDTYSHLWPDSEDRTREAVDLALRLDSPADQPRTAGAS